MEIVELSGGKKLTIGAVIPNIGLLSPEHRPLLLLFPPIFRGGGRGAKEIEEGGGRKSGRG